MKPQLDFNKIAEDNQREAAEYLSTSELLRLAMTSKTHRSIFTPLVDVRKLLHYVVRGEHEQVKSILKKEINLIVQRGSVTDCSGAAFDNISAFEYVSWALDKHMWAAMIACIPQDEEGKKVFARLYAQYNKVNTDGVTYRLNGKTITEKHFDFENTIIKELQTQVDSINAPGAKNWEAIDKQWREGVGGAQKRLPMHIVDEYCSNEPFYPVPKFISQPKSSKQFYHWVTDKNENWFSVDSKLSVDFAIYKGVNRRASPGVRAAWRCDLDAMTALCKVRTNDFIDLKSQLEDLMRQNNHHQVSQI